jgi:tRNA-Thr(GGU) m(6)t(6)A37 methyltransferase TsaA
MNKQNTYTIKPIGFVKNGIGQTPKNREGWSIIQSDVVIDLEFEEGLEGIEKFSHIIVLFWFDRITGDVVFKVRPRRRQDLPLMGLFSARTPNRPNRIGFTVVNLIRRQRNILTVTGLDALDGTPVIDIKPYLKHSDLIPYATQPEWVEKLSKNG